MALKNVSSFGFRYFRLPCSIITRYNCTKPIPSSIEKITFLDQFESSLPDTYSTETSDIITGYSSINVEILGAVVKFYKILGTPRIVLHVRSINDFGEIVIHRLRGLPEGPSKQVIEKLNPSNLVLVQGNIVQKRVEKEKGNKKILSYPSPISIFSVSLISRWSLNVNSSFSHAAITGVVTKTYTEVKQPKSNYVGQIDVLTWRHTQNNLSKVQTNRIMIGKETLRCFPFLPGIEKGEKMFVNGPLDYIEQPNLKGYLLVITAKQVVKMNSLGKENYTNNTDGDEDDDHHNNNNNTDNNNNNNI